MDRWNETDYSFITVVANEYNHIQVQQNNLRKLCKLNKTLKFVYKYIHQQK